MKQKLKVVFRQKDYHIIALFPELYDEEGLLCKSYTLDDGWGYADYGGTILVTKPVKDEKKLAVFIERLSDWDLDIKKRYPDPLKKSLRYFL